MTGDAPPPFAEPKYVTSPVLPPLDRYVELLAEIWRTGWVSNLGPFHQRLEQRIAAQLGVPNVSLWNNGTTALIGALRAVEATGEAITTPFTFPATVHALELSGLDPVFVDIDAETLTIAPERLEDAIGDRTGAIVPVHVYGRLCETKAIDRIAHDHGVPVVYDAAHSFGMSSEPLEAVSVGDATAFSFHPTKVFHTAEGGAVATRDEHVDSRLRRLRNFGFVGEDEVTGVGLNGKMNELQAALGLLMLDEVHSELERRRVLADRYEEALAGVDGLRIVTGRRVDGAQQFFVLRVDEAQFGMSRDHLHRALRGRNIFSRRYFFPLCSRLDAYASLPSARPEGLPNAERAASECLAMPFHGRLTEAEVDQISETVVWIREHHDRP